jgi:hypothetical protein
VAATAFLFGGAVSAASANTIKQAGGGSLAGVRLTATATNGKLTNYTTGTTAATCTTVTASGLVSSDSTKLSIDSLTFSGCIAAGIDIFPRTNAATTPWVFQPTGLGPSSFAVQFNNYNVATATINCDDGTPNPLYDDTYQASSSTPTGVTIQNGTASPFVPSKINGLNGGPLNRIDNNSCSLPSPAGLTGDIKIATVGGVAVNATNNPIVTNP